MDKLLNIKYGCLHGGYWMFYGIATSFSSAFLLARGYSNGEIGIILAAGSIAAVFLQPVIADFADRSKKVSLLGFVQLSTILLMAFTLMTFILQQKSAALWVVYVMNVAWLLTIQPLFNSLAFRLEETGIHINFGLCRSMGSLCYAVLCSFMGTLVEAKGVQVLPVSGEIILALLLFTLFVTKRQYNMMKAARLEKNSINDKAAGKAAGTELNDGKVNTVSAISDVQETPEDGEINLIQFIKRNKLFVAMNLASVGIFFSNSILNSFMLQIVEGVGGTSEDMGRILSVMAFLEIPALVLFDKIRKEFSCQTLLKIAAICFALKILLIYLAGSVTMIYIAHLLQTPSYGLFLPAIVLFIDEIMAHGEAVKGQALYTVMTTLATVIASILGGFILDASGPKSLLMVSTITTAVGALFVILLVDRIKRKE